MGGKKQNLVGQTFNRLTVLKHAGQDRFGKTCWKCRCLCGNLSTVNGSQLVRGKIKSCGCFHKERVSEVRKTHGLSKSNEYRTWSSILRRCYNPNTKDYPNYGGRGIRVCSRWKNSFENFLKDMGNRPSGMTIERKNNDRNYSPENCRWIVKKYQNRNTRVTVWLTFRGRRLPLVQWAEELSIQSSTLRKRLYDGWTIRRTLTTPLIRKVSV